ncbi:UDP-N-acetylmuramoyl-L-alanyl-D-glutamate--2,6-diaminopimelate ligase [soil metagenome]
MATLHDLSSALPHARLTGGAGGGVRVEDVTHDSRSARPGVLFACRPGRVVDGHDFAPRAVTAGASALLVERPLDLGVPELVVPSVVDALGPAAARVHGDPSAAFALCGVTGTNGKTTTAYLLDAVLRSAGHVTGLIGTVETVVAGTPVAGVRTTPEASDLQRLLRRMADAGVTAAAMEVSSHGLALGRVRGTRFAVAVFTNLSHDHLDFHRDLDDYFRAKARLFDPAYTPVAVVNVDDRHGRALAETTPVRVVRVSAAGRADATVRATDVRLSPDGAAFTARVRGRPVPVRIRLSGHFNVANALGAMAAAEVVGVPSDQAAAGLEALPGVPGRMERVDAGQGFTVLVDYAHTPDSLDNVLRAARRLAGPDGARVVVVVGCGGDRDRAKRPRMGRTAAELADLSVLTSDNPRTEDPLAILEAMRAGATAVPGARVMVEPDRRAGIAAALAGARPGDVVVVAGKGHETYQQFADRTVAFDDRAVVRELLGAAS